MCEKEPEWINNRFERSKRLSQYWYNRASDLHASAVVLWYSFAGTRELAFSGKELGLGSGFNLSAAIPPVFQMVSGLSLELLLKACIVRKDGIDSSIPKTHSLLRLASIVKLKLTEKEKYIFEVYSLYITWQGKYPVPKNLKEYEQAIKADRKMWRPINAKSKILRKYIHLDFETYEKLWNKSFEFYFNVPAYHRGYEWKKTF
jgi:hypothetical protein